MMMKTISYKNTWGMFWYGPGQEDCSLSWLVTWHNFGCSIRYNWWILALLTVEDRLFLILHFYALQMTSWPRNVVTVFNSFFENSAFSLAFLFLCVKSRFSEYTLAFALRICNKHKEVSCWMGCYIVLRRKPRVNTSCWSPNHIPITHYLESSERGEEMH